MWGVVPCSTALLGGDTDQAQVPAVLYLERVDVRGKLDYSGLPEVNDPAILSRDSNISL